ncbi:hypothetical protein J4E80_007329 [Alternaria sp. BMP 0032]|nr:hypothetical protein J4E80_007329 [Alternaria sp. BMP 0032]
MPEWKSHMDKNHGAEWAQYIHRFKWSCQFCGDEVGSFSNKDALIHHLTQDRVVKHPPSLDAFELARISLRGRVANPRPADQCPLCTPPPWSKDIEASSIKPEDLNMHVVAHLEHLALLSIPSWDEDVGAVSDTPDNGHSSANATGFNSETDEPHSEKPDNLAYLEYDACAKLKMARTNLEFSDQARQVELVQQQKWLWEQLRTSLDDTVLSQCQKLRSKLDWSNRVHQDDLLIQLDDLHERLRSKAEAVMPQQARLELISEHKVEPPDCEPPTSFEKWSELGLYRSMDDSDNSVIDHMKKVHEFAEEINLPPNITAPGHDNSTGQSARYRAHTLMVLRLDKNQKQTLELGGGKMDTVYIHSVYAILPPNFDPAMQISESDILAKVRVEQVKSQECRAVLLQPQSITDSQWQKLEVGCLAVLQSPPLGGTAGVRFMPTNGTSALQFEHDWHHSLKGKERLYLTNDDDAQFQIDLDHDGLYRINCVGDIFPNHISNTLTPLPGNESMSKLISRLEHIARFKLLKGLENPHIRLGNLPDLAYVTLEPSPNGREHVLDEYTDDSIWLPAAQSVERQRDGVYRVQHKEWFRFKVTNNSKNTIGCVILNFNPEMGISIMHSNLFYNIAPHDQLNIDLFVAISDTLQAAAARDIPIVDTFKIFVSVPEKDMSAMTLQKLRVAEDERYWGANESAENTDDLLQELATFGRDDAFPLSTQPKMDRHWQTFDFRVQTNPAFTRTSSGKRPNRGVEIVNRERSEVIAEQHQSKEKLKVADVETPVQGLTTQLHAQSQARAQTQVQVRTEGFTILSDGGEEPEIECVSPPWLCKDSNNRDD